MTVNRLTSVALQNAFRPVAITCCLVCIVSFAGCKEQPKIVTHRIPKSQSGLDGFRSASPRPEGTDAAAVENKISGPEGWTREKSNPMFPSDKFSKVIDGKKVVLSVMSLPSSNDWESNVQRWLGQVSMTMTAEEVDQITTELKVDGIASKKVRLFTDDREAQAIVGVMAVKGPLAWFIKLMGENATVEATENEFDAYVETLKLP